MTMHVKWMYDILTQGIRKMKTFTITKSGNADKNITKKQNKAKF